MLGDLAPELERASSILNREIGDIARPRTLFFARRGILGYLQERPTFTQGSTIGICGG
jgi:hypothetical protein